MDTLKLYLITILSEKHSVLSEFPKTMLMYKTISKNNNRRRVDFKRPNGVPLTIERFHCGFIYKHNVIFIITLFVCAI